MYRHTESEFILQNSNATNDSAEGTRVVKLDTFKYLRYNNMEWTSSTSRTFLIEMKMIEQSYLDF